MTATVAPIDAYDADAATLKAQQPNATASRRSKAGITDTSVWQLLCTISIVCYSLWGWYLFTFGVSDFRRGSADIQDTCPIAAQLQALDRIVPMGVLLRCCLSTKILRIIGRAKAVARNRNWRKRACCNPWTALYLGCWALPWFWLLGLVSTPGLGPPAINVAGNWTIANWPIGCEVRLPVTMESTGCAAAGASAPATNRAARINGRSPGVVLPCIGSPPAARVLSLRKG